MMKWKAGVRKDASILQDALSHPVLLAPHFPSFFFLVLVLIIFGLPLPYLRPF
jgi:hypothetical protein